ncbi:MAG TPA: DUF2169 domain-containing protein [Polyangium sp.]|nr:DUF2169 domain-containing protein [Polyangium sp.]
MELVSLCPLQAWGFVWQSPDGRHAQTVVVKATFKLAPSKVVLAEEQDPAIEEDRYWNDDPNRSILVPSDKAPYKPRADVMLVGHAYAPKQQPVRSLIARITVGDIDKSIEVFCDRSFRSHQGQLLEGSRFSKSRLSWERAAGGPESNNPVGMRFDAQPDGYGMIPIANLQPPGQYVSKRSDVFVPVCFAPIAPTWPTRKERLSRVAPNFPQPGWTEAPLPEGFDPGFFQAAPSDQQIPEVRPSERIILENLHPDHPRLVTSLPGLRPRALVERATGEREEVALVGDTLLIDTDRGVCTVVWRGRIGLRHAQEAGRISVTMSEEGDAPAMRAPLPTIATPADDDDDQENGLTTMVPPNETARPASKTFIPGVTGTHARVMPFVGSDQPASRPAAPAARASDAALPFLRTDQPPSVAPPSPRPGGVMPWPMSAGPAVVPPVAPPMGSPPLTPPGTVVPPLAGAPAPVKPGTVVPPLPIPTAAVSPLPVAPPPVPMAPVSPPPMASAATPAVRPPSEPSISPWASNAPTGAVAGAVGLGVASAVVATAATSSAKTGSAQALSDAAADAQMRAAPPPQPAIKPVVTTIGSQKPYRLPSNDVLDLLWYDDAFVPRIRANWEELVTELDFEPADPRKDLNAEDPEKTRTRHNVFGILSDGEMVEPSGISRVISEAVNQRGRFTPPLTLTGGELRFPFDEVETLKAMIVAMTPFLGADKRLKEMVDGMTELLKTPYLQGSTGIVDKLVRDLRNQFRESNRSLPASYLDGHVERLLLEQRRYAIRKVFGGEFIRAMLTVYVPEGQSKGSDASIPVYMPKSLDQTLPMLVTMKVRLIVECHLQQDPYDTSPYALRTVALGRAYQLDALRSGAKASGI